MGRRGNESTARRTPEQRRAKERVELILQSARALLAEGGLRALSTTSIARRAGVPVGSIYQYYPNRGAILAALYAEYLQDIQDVMHDWEQNGPYDGPWREFFATLHRRLKRAEDASRLGGAWLEASREGQQLQALDAQHAEIIAASSARMLRRFGSRWPEAKLRRLSLYYYQLNLATLVYQQQESISAKESLEWGTTALMALLESCLPKS